MRRLGPRPGLADGPGGQGRRGEPGALGERALLGERTLLISVDFEDWHQLVRRRMGDPDWERPGDALARQTDAALRLLEELGLRCTFFVLGMAARAHPELVELVASAGHEIASHGDEHMPVRAQTPGEFAADLHRAGETIEQLTGVRARGYRAPAFSVSAGSAWMFEVLAESGYAYDASVSSSLVVRDRVQTGAPGPQRLRSGLWEFPVATGKLGGVRVPLGGASYWSLAPRRVVIRAMHAVPSGGGLYLHPHELDPKPLRAGGSAGGLVGSGRGTLRTARRNLARRRAPELLRALNAEFQLIPYGEAHAKLSAGA